MNKSKNEGNGNAKIGGAAGDVRNAEWRRGRSRRRRRIGKKEGSWRGISSKESRNIPIFIRNSKSRSHGVSWVSRTAGKFWSDEISSSESSKLSSEDLLLVIAKD